LFLDTHVFGPKIARALRERGHDVRAADEERDLDGIEDEHLLELAADDGRVMITFDVKDFTTIARRWAEAGRTHAGLGIVVHADQREFGTIVDAVCRELHARSTQSSWRELTLFISRPSDVHIKAPSIASLFKRSHPRPASTVDRVRASGVTNVDNV
jgi:nucleoside-diphosphate-sugar epimerase